MSDPDIHSDEVTRANRTSRPVALSATTKSLIWVLAFAILLVIGFSVPSPYVIERPGPVVNTLGKIEVDGKTRPVIDIHGAETFEHEGALNLLTVTIVGNPDKPLGWFSLVPTLFDHTQELRPINEIFGDDRTAEERQETNRLLMDNSQSTATAAALTALEIPFEAEVLVGAVIPETPAENVLREGDQIMRVDGELVTGSSMLRRVIAEHDPQSEIELTLIREKTPKTVKIVPMRPEGQTRSVVGVLLETSYEFPFEVDIALEQIGGPSAGMMFALGIYEELTEGSLTGGHVISGTGTVDDAGDVGAIGGLSQKIWGAHQSQSELFIMPVANCAHLPQDLPENMQISPVLNTSEAIAAIEAFANGEEPPGIERCDLAVAQERSIE